MKSDYKGTGTMVEFAEQSNVIFAALQNAEVLVPPGFQGTPPELKFEQSDEGASLKLYMNDALMYNGRGITVTAEDVGAGSVSNVFFIVANGILEIYLS